MLPKLQQKMLLKNDVKMATKMLLKKYCGNSNKNVAKK